MALIAVIIFCVVVSQIYMLIASSTKVEVARAGKVSAKVDRYKRRQISRKKKVKGLKVFSVIGDSMIQEGIYDGNLIYVKEMNTLEERMNISTYPVLLFSISNMPKTDSRYKLRKFVSYIDSPQTIDWGVFYDGIKERIHINKELFVRMCEQKVSKMNFDDIADGTKYIVSETREDDFLYSIHAIDTVYGKVCYAS